MVTPGTLPVVFSSLVFHFSFLRSAGLDVHTRYIDSVTVCYSVVLTSEVGCSLLSRTCNTFLFLFL